MVSTHDAFSLVLARLDDQPREAFRIAQEIPNPSARCYALAWIGRYAQDSTAAEALRLARVSARACKDDYSRAAALAWPIRAAFDRNEHRLAAQLFADAVTPVAALATVSERAEILRLLCDASLPAGPMYWIQIVQQLIAQCPAHTHWRAARAHLRAISFLRSTDRRLAEMLVDTMSPGKLRNRAKRILDSEIARREPAFFQR